MEDIRSIERDTDGLLDEIMKKKLLGKKLWDRKNR